MDPYPKDPDPPVKRYGYESLVDTTGCIYDITIQLYRYIKRNSRITFGTSLNLKKLCYYLRDREDVYISKSCYAKKYYM